MRAWQNQRIAALICAALATTSTSLLGATPESSPPAIEWRTDYFAAYGEAKDAGKMLLVYFYDPSPNSIRNSFEASTLSDRNVRELMRQYIAVKLPTTTQVDVDGNSTRLLHHGAFSHMQGRQGVAIIDLKHQGRAFYGKPVSCLPFEQPVYFAPRYWDTYSIRTLLSLPPGSLTQRMLTYAVRCHPEGPASANGHPHPELFAASARHSVHQASILSQGHHNWGSRFHEIHHKVGGQAPTEVCAESWPGESLLQSCFSCVYCWRQSSGHWGAVRARQPAFGYDIRRGSNGIWYATGIFGGYHTGS